jgi:hypothetical protein
VYLQCRAHAGVVVPRRRLVVGVQPAHAREPRAEALHEVVPVVGLPLEECARGRNERDRVRPVFFRV